MFHRSMSFVVALGVWTVSVGLHLTAQASTGTDFVLHGRVVESLTRKSIARALVTSGDRRIATMTDSNGNFTLDVSVPASTDAVPDVLSNTASGPRFAQAPQLWLTARRPGYLQRGEQTLVTLDKTGTQAEVELELTPSADLRGVVMDEENVGAARVRVTLMEYQVQDGTPVWQQRTSSQSDDEGNFQFSSLEPGEYTVMSNEWSGEDPSFTHVSQQFPPRYLGDVRTLVAATKLNLAAGTKENVALHLRLAKYYPVKIPVQGLPPNTPMQVRVANGSTALGYSLGWNARTQAVEGALPGGEYVLTIESVGSDRSSVRMPLVVGVAAVEHVPVALTVNGTIPVRVHVELTGKVDTSPKGFAFSGNAQSMPTETMPVQIFLRSLDMQFGNGGSFRHGQGTEGVIENVAPGAYTVEASTIRGYIASMTSGGVDLLRRSLLVGDGGTSDPIDIVVRDDSAVVSGVVDLAGHSSSRGLSILMVEIDGGQISRGYVQADLKFNIANVAPGTYRMFAVDARDFFRLPYRDAAAMRRYDSLATTVTVSAGQHIETDVRLMQLELAGMKE